MGGGEPQIMRDGDDATKVASNLPPTRQCNSPPGPKLFQLRSKLPPLWATRFTLANLPPSAGCSAYSCNSPNTVRRLAFGALRDWSSEHSAPPSPLSRGAGSTVRVIPTPTLHLFSHQALSDFANVVCRFRAQRLLEVRFLWSREHSHSRR